LPGQKNPLPSTHIDNNHVDLLRDVKVPAAVKIRLMDPHPEDRNDTLGSDISENARVFVAGGSSSNS